MDADRCISCGAIIPEGAHICGKCKLWASGPCNICKHEDTERCKACKAIKSDSRTIHTSDKQIL